MKLRKIPLVTGLSPHAFYKKLRMQYKNTFLFQLGARIHESPKFTLIGFDPYKLIVLNNEDKMKSVFKQLREELEPFALSDDSNMFAGGLFGVFTYDCIRSVEILPNINKNDKQFPDVLLGLFLDGIVYNHLKNKIHYFYHPKTLNRYKIIKKILNNQVEVDDPFRVGPLEYQTSKEEFLKQVSKIKEHISNGEVFQTVLSQRIAARFSGDPFILFERLCEINPSPYLFFIELLGFHIFGASPETLVSIENGLVKTFPIAGSYPRGTTKKQKYQYAKNLLADPKENAEHNMLVDLARNDLGKVCKFGSIHITKYREVEEFSHIIHLVSTVEGQLREEKDAYDVLEAVFPAGTVTGAPKIRSMEIIEVLENMHRGPYAGAIGYISCNLNMDTAITIRTFYTSHEKIYLQAGAGIVIDSDPEKEYDETLNKLQALLSALETRGTVATENPLIKNIAVSKVSN